MKQKILLTVCLLITIISYSQNTITGKVQNIENSEVLSYVNIGVLDKRIGTVSNDHGFFTLKLNDSILPSDTITFSILGFKAKRLALSDLKQKNNLILLSPQMDELDEVVVHSFREQNEIIGRNKEGNMSVNFFSPYDENIDDRLSREIGTIIKIDNSYKIKDLFFHISINEFKRLKFRLNFYKIENKIPAELINNKDIIIEIGEDQLGWVEVDLKPFNLVLDESLEEVAVTFQWIESEKKFENSERFGITNVSSIFNRNTLFRDKGMDDWKKWKLNLSLYLNVNVIK